MKDKMTIFHADGTTTVVDDPFGPLKELDKKRGCPYCGGVDGCHPTGGITGQHNELSARDWEKIYWFVKYVQLPFLHRIILAARNRNRETKPK